MGFFSKLFTAFRGAATEAGEAIVDTQALRILDQEVRDSKRSLDAAKENLAKVIAQQMGVEREVKRLKKTLEEYEGYALQALDKGDEALATELAEKVAEIENELEVQQSVLDSYKNNVSTLKQTVRKTETSIKAMEREINVVKTSAKVQEANEAISTRFSGTDSSLKTATASLERIKKRQQEKSDQMTAAMNMHKEELGDNLQDKLRDAGIVNANSSTNSVLERLKAKRKPAAKAEESTTPPPSA